MNIPTLGIIGAGTMGNGIAQACAVAGLHVVMVDISDAAVARGLSTVAGSLERLLKKDKISAADRESAYVIDGLMHNDVVSSDLHSTDTPGTRKSCSASSICWAFPSRRASRALASKGCILFVAMTTTPARAGKSPRTLM